MINYSPLMVIEKDVNKIMEKENGNVAKCTKITFKKDLRSLDFVINRFFMKLFCTNVMDTVKMCQDYFNFELPSKRKKRKGERLL